MSSRKKKQTEKTETDAPSADPKTSSLHTDPEVASVEAALAEYAGAEVPEIPSHERPTKPPVPPRVAPPTPHEDSPELDEDATAAYPVDLPPAVAAELTAASAVIIPDPPAPAPAAHTPKGKIPAVAPPVKWKIVTPKVIRTSFTVPFQHEATKIGTPTDDGWVRVEMPAKRILKLAAKGEARNLEIQNHGNGSYFACEVKIQP